MSEHYFSDLASPHASRSWRLGSRSQQSSGSQRMPVSERCPGERRRGTMTGVTKHDKKRRHRLLSAASSTWFAMLSSLPLPLIPEMVHAADAPPGGTGSSSSYLGGIFDLFKGVTQTNQVSNFYTAELNLDEDGFKTLMATKKMAAVLFFSPTCVYSHALQPIWDQVARKMETKVPVVRVDATTQKGARLQKYKLAESYPGYPSVKLIVEDGGRTDIFEYEPKGYRTTMETLCSWLQKHLTTGLEVHSLAEFRSFHFQNPLFVVGLFDDDTPVDAPRNGSDTTTSSPSQLDNKHNVQTFIEASKHFENVLFAESRKSTLSREIADYLREHHILKCEVVSIGASKSNVKAVPVSQPDMQCRGPQNPQRAEWGDSFSVSSNKTHVIAERTDQKTGWDQGLQYSCCLEAHPADEKPLELKIPSVTMFTPHDDQVYTFPSDHTSHIDVKELIEFVQKYRQSLLSGFTVDTINDIFQSAVSGSVPVTVYITDGTGKADDPPDSTELIVRDFAKQTKGRQITAKAYKADDAAYKYLIEMLDLNGNRNWPVVRLISRNPNARSRATAVIKYKIPVASASGSPDKEPDITIPNLMTMIDQFEAQTLKPYYRSEPAPDPNYVDPYDPIAVVVGSTFYDDIANRKASVFINIYAPWCGHSKRMQPVYRELALRMQVPGNEKLLKIAKIDGTANEISEIPVVGYPTLLLFKMGDGKFEFTEYNGPRTADDLIAWLKESLGTGLKSLDKIPPNVAVGGYNGGNGHSEEM
ncbi:unnamed protein product [Amoebophrya sp. A25]|nr:unnamed protein product [Amoebophrya sp. A25]|eukprot:GSA25T00019015001.1